MKHFFALAGFFVGVTSSTPAYCPVDRNFFQLHKFEQVGYAQDRCCNPGCLALLKPGAKKLVGYKTSASSAGSSVFFGASEHNVTPPGVEEIKAFVKKIPLNSHVAVMGYTDGCGTNSSNLKLSKRRSQAVMNQLRSSGFTGKITQVSHGEISNDHDPKSRRVDIGMYDSFKLYEPPPKLIADFYLIDGSGSMEGSPWEKYRRSISFHAPPHAVIYTATRRCVKNNTNFDHTNPYGGTEIWFAYWSLLDIMKPGDSLVIISDFDSDFPLTMNERLRLQQKVREKGVTVRAITIK